MEFEASCEEAEYPAAVLSMRSYRMDKRYALYSKYRFQTLDYRHGRTGQGHCLVRFSGSNRSFFVLLDSRKALFVPMLGAIFGK